MDITYYKQYEPIFGSWYITGLIGAGSYGQVYTIEREELGIKYQAALKVITIPFSDAELRNIESEGMTTAEVTSFYESMAHNISNEFILMSKLKGNSNIVSYEDHQVIEHPNDVGWDILIRMELLEPLVDRIKDEELEPDVIIKLGIDLCKALELCNKYGIVHRDIKPDNIFIAPSGDYKIGDFGIAKIIDSSSVGLSRKGTFLYMAPEAYKGDRYGASADLYSVGLVLYKLLNNNRTPFLPEYPEPIHYNDREQSLFRRMQGERIPPIKGIDDELNRILNKACQYNSHDRYRRASDMRRDLEVYQLNKQNNTLGELQHKRTKRKTSIIGLCAAILIAIALLIPKNVTSVDGIQNEIIVPYGETYELNYTVHPFYFSSTKPEYRIVDKKIIDANNDSITAKKVGTTTVNVVFGKLVKKVNVTVKPKVTDISNVDSEYYLQPGNSIKLDPINHPEKYLQENKLYSSSNEAIAVVDEQGNITAVSAGTASVKISSGGCIKTIKIIVSNPVVYKGNSKKSNSKGKSKSSDGYFDSSDDESF